MVLAVTGATGKIGGATLHALVKHKLLPQSEIIVVTTSALDSDKVNEIRSSFPQLRDIRQASIKNAEALKTALTGVHQLYLVSTPAIQLDFNDAPPNTGRESEHICAIDAAIAAGVRHIVYTSLAFTDESNAGVMRAHLRTEKYLEEKSAQGKITYTSLREGLYNESWPLYLGHYKIGHDQRNEIVVAGDGPISWTSIKDLGAASAIVCAGADDEKYRNRVMTLSQHQTVSLSAVAKWLNVKLAIVSMDEYIAHYRNEHDMDQAFLSGWASTYPSVTARHCDQGRNSPLEEMLSSIGIRPVPFEETFQEMMKQA